MSSTLRHRIPKSILATRAVQQATFNSTLEAQWVGRSAKERRYGIALSGGCDSMALTSLCAALHRHDDRFLFSAFIIDHAARPESRDEAHAVKNIVKAKLGSSIFETKILRLDWTREDIADPLKHPAFETLARKLRYQALTSACLSRDIRLLLTGHHADDDTETVLFRMANGYTHAGLAGMSPGSSDIPDATGIYGCQSGSPRRVEASRTQLNVLSDKHIVTRTVEDGGLQIFRPLLAFDKTALESTCLLNGIRWVDDPTNGDPLMGGRNAVRHVLKLGVLPNALQKPSLLRLANTKREEMQQRENVVQKIYDDTSIKLNLSTGSVTATFPDNIRKQLTQGLSDLDSPISITETSYRASLLLRRIILLASPLPTFNLRNTLEPLRLIFPWLFPASTTALPSQLTVAKTLLLTIPSNPLRFEVHRCRPPRAEVGRETTILVPAPYLRSGSLEYTSSAWRLFDGRYWTRMRYRRFDLGPGQRISMRFLRTADVDALSKDPGVAEYVYEKLLSVLKRRVPIKARYALPAVVESYLVRDEKGEGGRRREERVLALPTLGWSRSAGAEKGALVCEWRYKKVELGSGELHQFVS